MTEIPDATYIERIFSRQTPIHYIFLNRIEETNITIGQVQIDNIYYTLTFITNDHNTIEDDRKEGGRSITTSTWMNGTDVGKTEDERGEGTRDFSWSNENVIMQKSTRTKLYHLTKTNIQKCIQWCIQHNLMYNY